MDPLDPFSPSNMTMLSYADADADADADFDYTDFLNPDTPYPAPSPLATNLVSTSDSSGKATPSSPSNVSSGAEVVRRPSALETQRQRLERRGHTKSRQGCYNCKRRRIKCQESRPACGHCVKTGLKCEYPSLPQITHQPHNQIPIFSLQDMRFFQHFLTQCFPHHPLQQEEIWTHEIPCIAQNHDFLMHAILGFAASELIYTDPSLVTVAMAHRVKAIRSIKKRLAEAHRANTTYEEANALVATCFALTFQSVLLDDGLAEYMTFIRGILVVSMQMAFKGIKPIFANLLEQDSDALLGPYMEGLPLIQKGWADAAKESIEALRPLCVEGVEVEYYENMMQTVENLYINSYAAYKSNSQFYAWFMMLSHNAFQEVINPGNQTMMLLHSHCIALSQIMTFISQQELELRKKHAPTPPDGGGNMDPGFQRWLKYLNARVDYEHQLYNQWPMWVEAQLDRDLTFFGRSVR